MTASQPFYHTTVVTPAINKTLRLQATAHDGDLVLVIPTPIYDELCSDVPNQYQDLSKFQIKTPYIEFCRNVEADYTSLCGQCFNVTIDRIECWENDYVIYYYAIIESNDMTAARDAIGANNRPVHRALIGCGLLNPLNTGELKEFSKAPPHPTYQQLIMTLALLIPIVAIVITHDHYTQHGSLSVTAYVHFTLMAVGSFIAVTFRKHSAIFSMLAIVFSSANTALL